MKTIINKSFIYLLITSVMAFTSCEKSSDDLIEENTITELTIEQKVAILESDDWLLKGFEDNVMETFVDGELRTHYATDGVFGEHNPVAKEYTITGELLLIDFHFGNTGTYALKLSCNNNIIEFLNEEEEVVKTLYRRNSNYEECL